MTMHLSHWKNFKKKVDSQSLVCTTKLEFLKLGPKNLYFYKALQIILTSSQLWDLLV